MSISRQGLSQQVLWANGPQNWISNLPNELLMETFKLVIYDPPTPKPKAPAFPIQYTLTAVCRQWRYFVLDAKSLWTTVYLGPHASNLYYNFFERSRNALLDIIVVLDFSYTAMSDHLTDSIASTLVAHAARTRSVCFNLCRNNDLIEHFFQQWINIPKPCLTKLDVVCSSGRHPATLRDLTDPIPRPPAFSTLRILTVRNVKLATIPSLIGLTTLDLHAEQAIIVSLWHIVKQFPSLARLVLRQLSLHQPEDPANTSDSSPIDAPSIKELIVHLANNSAVDDICRLYLPNLTYLELLGHHGIVEIMQRVCTSKLTRLKKVRLCMMPPSLRFTGVVSALQELESSIDIEIAETYFTYARIDDQIAFFNLPCISSLTFIGITTPLLAESLGNTFQCLDLQPLPFPINIQVDRKEWLGDEGVQNMLHEMFGSLLTLQHPVVNKGVLDHQYCLSVFSGHFGMGDRNPSDTEGSVSGSEDSGSDRIEDVSSTDSDEEDTDDEDGSSDDASVGDEEETWKHLKEGPEEQIYSEDNM